MPPPPPSGRVIAVLGPTNTGKTYLALERMLGHASGMIGFPLRLLARENYDRIVRLKGANSVALITGEERILPPHPRWIVCTVEAMPMEQQSDFLAIDEVQLAADPDRGHIFTNRILWARGREETMLLGSETIRPLLKKLIPHAEFISRPRFSRLTYAGVKKLDRLPRRSAIVAFSAADVYSIAELIRRQNGGAAVVLGALSPRTRNAQVAMYQAGDVHYMVATDAIGMGLNMDIDHVCFAALRKFDGRTPRTLNASEIAQIAGRAGRHMKDGTFGISTEMNDADTGGLDPELISQVENHTFPPLRSLFWRNPDLHFTSLEALLQSLSLPPKYPGLTGIRPADDHLALKALTQESDIRAMASSPDRLRLLWDVSRIPDFRKVTPEIHARFLAVVYRHLTSSAGTLPSDWVTKHLRKLDRVDGDTHTLMDRIASIRIWTYISHRMTWLSQAHDMQEQARETENRLSDALHRNLTKRFVDVRTSILAARLKQGSPLFASVSKDDRVTIEGHVLGTLDGLTFIAEKGENRLADRTLTHAADKALRGEMAHRVSALISANDSAFSLSPRHYLCWNNAEVARLSPGSAPFHPRIEVTTSLLLTSEQRESIRKRLSLWLETQIKQLLFPLTSPPPPSLSSAARGLLYRLEEGFGATETKEAHEQIASLSPEDRKSLTRLGLRFGTEHIFFPALFQPEASRLRAVLWATALGVTVPVLPDSSPSFRRHSEQTPAFCAVIGFRAVSHWAIRMDALEQFAYAVRKIVRNRRNTTRQEHQMSPHLASLVALPPADTIPLLAFLGYRTKITGKSIIFQPKRHSGRNTPHSKRTEKPSGKRTRTQRISSGDNPFSVLKNAMAQCSSNQTEER